MILESIVTTRNSDGSTNIAPMGPHCTDFELASFELRPFCSSTTYQNLKRTGQGVLHVTDDVLLFAKAATGGGNGDAPLVSAEKVDAECLADCCRRYEFESTWIGDSENRAAIQCRTVHRQRVRDFFGFNRARHAVIEASILASRIDFLPLAEIVNRFEEFQTLVEKTGGENEQQAFAYLKDFVANYQTPVSETRG